MKKIAPLLWILLLPALPLLAQVEPNAGSWKTWFISSGKEYRLPAPASYKDQIEQVISCQKDIDSNMRRQINYWNAGAPGYRWYEMIGKLWVTNTNPDGALSYMLLNAGIYDATIAAWDTKYAYKTTRPFAADKRIKLLATKPESPSYPCEHSVAAGVAVTIISHFYPKLADSVKHMAERAMASRIAAGVSFPSDTKAGFELGKKIAEAEIEFTKDYTTKETWDKKVPQGPNYWRGDFAMHPLAGKNKTVVLKSGSEFRPPAPPDFAKDMAEMKSYKQTFSSRANAFYFASQNPNDDLLSRKIFENNLHLNPPRAARIYAITAIGTHDAFIACWDAKYTYWGIRPDQYDTTYKPLMASPPFPGYPSGHATISGMIGVLYSWLFPEDRALFEKRAKDAAESRFQAGIHFRTDNEVGLDLGRKVALAVINRVKNDGADNSIQKIAVK